MPSQHETKEAAAAEKAGNGKIALMGYESKKTLDIATFVKKMSDDLATAGRWPKSAVASSIGGRVKGSTDFSLRGKGLLKVPDTAEARAVVARIRAVEKLIELF